MATITSTSISNQYTNYFSKQLLDHAVHDLFLNQFAKTAELPKTMGHKAVRFMRKAAASSANVQTLTEGTPISTFAEHALTPVDATLVQLGEATKITDVVGWTNLFDTLKEEIASMGEDAALKADDVTRNEVVVNVNTAGQKRYSQGLANFAAVVAASVSAAKYVSNDGLDACTRLRINRAPKINGAYIGIVPPQISRDLRLDSRWVDVSKYANAKAIFKGEIGELDGVRYLEGTNPFQESSTEGTYDAAGGIFTSIFTGKDAYGVPKLAGTSSPWKPQVIIVNQPDKADPLNQFMTAGWKAFWVAKLLNESFICTVRSKTAFV